MDPRLQELIDHHEIRKTLAEYCVGSDRCDAGLMASVYAEDSWDNHGTRNAPGPEFARATVASVLASSETLAHLLGQSLIRVNGDEAGAETYFIAAMMVDGETRFCNQLGGRFVDRLVRVGDGWKVKHRVAVRDWSLRLPVEQDWETAQLMTPGQRSNDDPGFAVLGWTHGGLSQTLQG